MSLLDTELSNSRRWARVGDFYEITRKPRGLDISVVDAIPFAPMEAIPQGGNFEPKYVCKAPDTITSGTYFEKADILVAKITPSFENGKQALALALPAAFGYASTEVIPLRPKHGSHDRRLLFYYLLHPDIRAFVAEKMEGTTGRQRIPENVLLDLAIPEIDAKEQATIADALHLIQQAMLVETRSLDICSALKRAAMRELFTRGLRGEAQKETEIGLVPESWALTPAEHIFKLTSGKTRPDHLSQDPTNEKPFPVLGGNGVMGYSSEWHLESDKILVIGRVGEYCGAIHVASGKVWITDNALYVKEWLKPSANIRYIAAFLHYFDLNRFKRMAGQPLVTQGMINEHSIPIPSLDEQGEIVEILDAIDRKIDLHKCKRAVLEELFKTLLHKLMTGEIRVADLDLSVLKPAEKAEAAE